MRDNLCPGIGMLHNQFLRRLLHAVIRGSADAILDVLRRNFWRATCVVIGDAHTARGCSTLIIHTVGHFFVCCRCVADPLRVALAGGHTQLQWSQGFDAKTSFEWQKSFPRGERAHGNARTRELGNKQVS